MVKICIGQIKIVPECQKDLFKNIICIHNLQVNTKVRDDKVLMAHFQTIFTHNNGPLKSFIGTSDSIDVNKTSRLCTDK